MQATKWLRMVMVLTTCGATLAGITSDVPVQAKAKSRTSLKTVPKKLRGTWYDYRKTNGKGNYSKVKFTTKKVIYGSGRDKQVSIVHPLKLNKAFSSADAGDSKKINWGVAYAKRGYTVFGVWGSYRKSFNQSKTIRDDGVGYKIVHKTYKGKRIKVLKSWWTSEMGNGSLYSYDYHTKAQAKHFNPKGQFPY